MCDFLDRFSIAEWFLGIICASLIIWCIAAIYDEATSEHISIRKDSWQCTRSHSVTTFIPAGKVLVPQVREECDVYERK